MTAFCGIRVTDVTVKSIKLLVYARARGLENLDVLMSCRKMFIASSVPFQIYSIKLPSSF